VGVWCVVGWYCIECGVVDFVVVFVFEEDDCDGFVCFWIV